MTFSVYQLIEHLKMMPLDAPVRIQVDSDHFDGEYQVYLDLDGAVYVDRFNGLGDHISEAYQAK